MKGCDMQRGHLLGFLLSTIMAVGCNPPIVEEDAGVDAGNSGFRGSIGLVTGAANAVDPEVVRDWRRKVKDAQQRAGLREVRREANLQDPTGDPILEDIARLERDERLRATLPREHKPLVWSKTPTWRRGELVVTFAVGAHSKLSLHAAVGNLLREAGLDDGRTWRVSSCTADVMCLVHVFDENDKPLDLLETERMAMSLRKVLPSVDATLSTLSLNYYRHIMAAPNDEYYPMQWHYEAASIPAAWDITTGSPTVVMAVLDTGGVLEHPDMQGRWLQGADLISDPGVAGDGNARDTDATDVGDQAYGDASSWHGTHVGGTIGASTNNQLGVAGVMWTGGVLPVRTLGLGGAGTDFDILSGMYWSVGAQADDVPANQFPAKIINLSLGGPSTPDGDQLWTDVTTDVLETRAEEFGHPIFVVAAGNEDQDVANSTPGNLERVITVGASRFNGERASYSNWGAQIDIMGPGGETTEDLNQDTFGDGVLSCYESAYNFNQGTSMATPHVAGIIGLMASLNPGITHDEAQTILKSTANPAGQCNEGCGTGNVNAANALLALGGEVAEVPVIALDQSVMVFSPGQTARDVVIVNVGAVDADFEVTVVGPQADLFSATPVTGTVATGALLPIQVRLTRGDFEAGAANVIIEGVGAAQGQSLRLDVSFSDVEPPPPVRVLNSVEVSAFAVDDNNELTLAAKVVTTSGEGFAWELFPLHDGNYYVFGVGDDNADGAFDYDRESIGAWPRIDRPQVLELGENQILSPVDFSLTGGFFIPTNTGAAGDPCTDDSQCAFAPDAQCIVDGAWPSGYCTRDCSDGYCGAGSSCEALACGEGTCFLCLKSCTADSQCRTGGDYVCDAYGSCTPLGF